MKRKTFEIKDEHIKLLRNAYIGWDDCEFGAPAIDCKRPYGNSDVYGDIARILDIKQEGDDHESYSEEQISYMSKLHNRLPQKKLNRKKYSRY